MSLVNPATALQIPEIDLNSILASLKNSGIAATKGIMLANANTKILSQIPTDFHIRSFMDPRDCIGGELILRRSIHSSNQFI